MGGTKDRPIKVMHVIARMNVGGPAVEIAELMRGLDPKEVEQLLVTGYCTDDEADFLETQAPDIEAIRFEGLGRSIRPMDDAKALAHLIKTIRSSRPDIVHTHTAKAGVVGRLAAKAAGVGAKIVHTHHGHLLHGYFGHVKTRAVIQLERKLAKITDRIVTVGETVRDDLLNVGIGKPSQYAVIRSGITLGPLPSKAAAREDLRIPEDSVVVALVGRVTQVKRPDRFLEIVEQISSRGLRAHFLVVGGGDLAQAVRERVESARLPVSMLGWRSDLERIFAATDVLLLTSDNEGMPISIIQATHAGVPVVATDVGSIGEYLVDGVDAFLCRKDSWELANALETLIREPQLREAMSAARSHRDLGDYNVESFLRRHVALYLSLASGSQSIPRSHD